jgi:galactoside 3-L-fucosyltransferase 11
MKHISVDSYGECLHNKDLPERLHDPAATFNHEDFFELLSVYKFMLAFENAYCKDYMTEKIARPLHIGIVPIYKGSPVIQDWMPSNHSIILVDNFSSPKELAEFIRYLDENDAEYDKYLEYKLTDIQNKFVLDHLEKREWHDDGSHTINFFQGFECYLCKQLSDRFTAEKSHADDPSSPLLPQKMADQSHLECPAPERLDVGRGMSTM